MAIFIHSLPRSTDITATEAERTKKDKRTKGNDQNGAHDAWTYKACSSECIMGYFIGITMPYIERAQKRCSILIQKYMPEPRLIKK